MLEQVIACVCPKNVWIPGNVRAPLDIPVKGSRAGITKTPIAIHTTNEAQKARFSVYLVRLIQATAEIIHKTPRLRKHGNVAKTKKKKREMAALKQKQWIETVTILTDIVATESIALNTLSHSNRFG